MLTYFEREESTVEGAVAVGAGATSIDDAVDCAARVDGRGRGRRG